MCVKFNSWEYALKVGWMDYPLHNYSLKHLSILNNPLLFMAECKKDAGVLFPKRAQ